MAGVSTAPARARGGLRIGAGDGVRVAVIVALFVFCFVGLPPLLSAYWVDVSTSVAIYSVPHLLADIKEKAGAPKLEAPGGHGVPNSAVSGKAGAVGRRLPVRRLA